MRRLLPPQHPLLPLPQNLCLPLSQLRPNRALLPQPNRLHPLPKPPLLPKLLPPRLKLHLLPNLLPPQKMHLSPSVVLMHPLLPLNRFPLLLKSLP